MSKHTPDAPENLIRLSELLLILLLLQEVYNAITLGGHTEYV
jgi:hypothetical protein